MSTAATLVRGRRWGAAARAFVQGVEAWLQGLIPRGRVVHVAHRRERAARAALLARIEARNYDPRPLLVQRAVADADFQRYRGFELSSYVVKRRGHVVVSMRVDSSGDWVEDAMPVLPRAIAFYPAAWRKGGDR